MNARMIARDWMVFAVAVLVIALDQITKLLVRATYTPGQSVPEDWPVRLTYIENTGAAFGLFPNQTVVLAVVALVAIALIVFSSGRLPGTGAIVRAGLGLLLGGAVGNLIDRVARGSVTDFIDLGFWPVGNLADCAIGLGVGLLAYFILFTSPEKQESPSPDATGASRESQ